MRIVETGMGIDLANPSEIFENVIMNVHTGYSSFLADITANDLEGGMITYTILDSTGTHQFENDVFKIVNNYTGNGESSYLYFKDNVYLDYETNESIDLTIRATDPGGLSYDKTFTFDVVDDPSDNNLNIQNDNSDEEVKAEFTASIDKWFPDSLSVSEPKWMDDPIMKLHRKDISDEVGIDLIDKDGSPGHKHKPNMDKGNYELRVEHHQETDGAIDIEDVMGVLSLARGKSSVNSTEHKLAADWNGDGLIDIEDVMGVLSRSRGLNKDDEWRFYDKTSNTGLWDNDSKTNKLDIILDGDDEIDLSAILRGDVNGSYNAAVHNRAAPVSAPEPNYAPLPLSHEDELVNLQLDIV